MSCALHGPMTWTALSWTVTHKACKAIYMRPFYGLTERRNSQNCSWQEGTSGQKSIIINTLYCMYYNGVMRVWRMKTFQICFLPFFLRSGNTAVLRTPHSPQLSLFTIHWDTIAGWHFSSVRCIWIIHDLPFRWHHGARAPTRYESYSIYTSNVQLFTIYTVNNLSQDAEWCCQVIRVADGRVWSSRSIWLFTARDISPDKRISGLLNAITVSKTDNKDW